MVKRTRDFGVLLAGIAALFAAVAGLSRGGYNYFGVVVAGTQVHLFAWSSLAMSFVLLFIYFRGTKPHQ
jgi:hypothetical protein